MQYSSEHRISTKQRLGTLTDVVFDLPVQREAAAAAVCGEEALRWCHPVERPAVLQPRLALFSGSGGHQRRRQPPTGSAGSRPVPRVGMGPKGAMVEACRGHNYESEVSRPNYTRT